MIHGQRSRAESFGAEAERYERTRPGYPVALVADLLAALPPPGRPRVLDVGCGTGKLGRLFAARGCAVLGVEIDPRMAAVAARGGLAVEVGRFEDWDPAGRRFDLVVSGQAWHWIDPERGTARAAEALAPGGALAVVWNVQRHEPGVLAVLEAVYRRHAPALADTSAALGHVPRDAAGGHVEALGRHPALSAPAARSYPFDLRYSRDEWLDLIQTHSDHAALAPAARTELLAGLADAIDRLGGSLTLRCQTVAFVSARR
jgi:SAM-dependent methyltransferase